MVEDIAVAPPHVDLGLLGGLGDVVVGWSSQSKEAGPEVGVEQADCDVGDAQVDRVLIRTHNAL